MSARWLLCTMLIVCGLSSAVGTVGGGQRPSPANRTSNSRGIASGRGVGQAAARDATARGGSSNDASRRQPSSPSSANTLPSSLRDDAADPAERIRSDGPAGRQSGQHHHQHQHPQQREGSARLPIATKAAPRPGAMKRAQAVGQPRQQQQQQQQQHVGTNAKDDPRLRDRGNFTASAAVQQAMALDGTSARCLFHLHGIPKAGTTWLEFIVGQLDECVCASERCVVCVRAACVVFLRRRQFACATRTWMFMYMCVRAFFSHQCFAETDTLTRAPAASACCLGRRRRLPACRSSLAASVRLFGSYWCARTPGCAKVEVDVARDRLTVGGPFAAAADDDDDDDIDIDNNDHDDEVATVGCPQRLFTFNPKHFVVPTVDLRSSTFSRAMRTAPCQAVNVTSARCVRIAIRMMLMGLLLNSPLHTLTQTRARTRALRRCDGWQRFLRHSR
jgi:hypothetical protein